jgi:hypothetical protein
VILKGQMGAIGDELTLLAIVKFHNRLYRPIRHLRPISLWQEALLNRLFQTFLIVSAIFSLLGSETLATNRTA